MEAVFNFIARRLLLLFLLMASGLLFGAFLYPVMNMIPARAVIESYDADKGNAVIRMRVGADEILQVREGMEVHIKWDLYPYQAYGLEIGSVDSIDLKPVKSSESDKTMYLVRAKLKLPASGGSGVKFAEGQEGGAEIVLGETNWARSLMQ